MANLQCGFVLQSKLQQFIVAFDIELLADVEPVVFDRPNADEELFRNFLARQVVGQESEEFFFGRRQTIHRRYILEQSI